MNRRLPHALAFVLWLAVAIAITYWALIFTSRREPVERLEPGAPGDVVTRSLPADTSAIAALFGAKASTANGDVKLLGIIAEGRAGKGVAVLSYQGGAVQTFMAGEEISAGVTLLEVGANGVTLSQAGARREVVLPEPGSPERASALKELPVTVKGPR